MREPNDCQPRFGRDKAGQSLVEYVVLLVLIGIIVVTVVAGIGQRSRAREARANEAAAEAAVASQTPPGGKPPVGGVAGQTDRP